MSLQRELREAKHDCDLMSKLLEEQESKATSFSDREKLLLEAEARLKDKEHDILL